MAKRYRETQRRIIAYVHQYKVDPENNGFSPTYREIADELECALSTAYNTVQRIVARNRPGRPCELDLDDKGRIVVPNFKGEIVKADDKKLRQSLEHL